MTIKTSDEQQLFDRCYRRRFDAAFDRRRQECELYNKFKDNELKGSALEQFDNINNTIKRNTKKYLLTQLILGIPLYLLIIFAAILFETASNIGFVRIYNESAWMIYATGASIIPAILSIIVILRQYRKYIYVCAEISDTDGIVLDRRINETLEIPENTVEVEIFRRNVSQKTKRTFVKTSQRDFVKMYRQGDYVYILDLPHLLKIPRRDCMSADLLNQKKYFLIGARPIGADVSDSDCATVERFNQNKLYRIRQGLVDNKDPSVREFGIKSTGDGGARTNFFGRLTFQSNGIIWTMEIMPTSFETVKRLFQD